MAETLQLTVNGQSRELMCENTPTLLAVLALLDLKADRIAVELNGKIARRTAWGDMYVQSGDKLEIVHFVGGGASS